MSKLTAIERIVIESIGSQKLPFEEIISKSGLQNNVCFNILQALLIKGFLKIENGSYNLNPHFSTSMNNDLHDKENKKNEFTEFVEAIVNIESEKILCFEKVALSERDEKIFKAMLWNLESFLKDAHSKAVPSMPLKNRKVIFWGMGQVDQLIGEILKVN
jgi:hypothetical protein